MSHETVQNGALTSASYISSCSDRLAAKLDHQSANYDLNHESSSLSRRGTLEDAGAITG